MRRGQSLIETLISCFLLVSITLAVVTLLGTAMRGHLHAERITTASRVAEKTLARLQAWARDPVNFRSGPAAYRAFSGDDPDEPGFHVDVDQAPLLVFSPCRSLEAPYVPLGTARDLAASVVSLRIEVSWGSGPRDRVQLWSELAEPPRPLALAPVVSAEGHLWIPPGLGAHPLQITRVGGPPDPVPADAVIDFQARLVDASGNAIPDVMFEWYVQPVSGNATLVDGSRTRRAQSVQNRYNFNPFTSTWGHAPGIIRVRARARYQGLDIVQETPDIVLGAP